MTRLPDYILLGPRMSSHEISLSHDEFNREISQPKALLQHAFEEVRRTELQLFWLGVVVSMVKLIFAIL